MSLQQKLRELFVLDQQVRGLESRFEAASRRRGAQTRLRDQLKTQYTELSQQLKQTQATAHNLETQVGELDARIARQREQMNSVHSNKEYSALLVEVNTLKVEKSKLEDAALAEMQRVDALKAEAEALESKIADREKLMGQADAEVQAARAEVGQRLDEAIAKRDAARAELPAEALAAFDRNAEAYDGESLAEVEEQNRRSMEYACGGCFIQIPVERVNTLMTRPDQLVICPSCSRILYLGDELRSALTPNAD